MIDAEKVALARAVMTSYLEPNAEYCVHCGGMLLGEKCPHSLGCPVHIAHRVIAESERGK
jgi:hypothetical protein